MVNITLFTIYYLYYFICHLSLQLCFCVYGASYRQGFSKHYSYRNTLNSNTFSEHIY